MKVILEEMTQDDTDSIDEAVADATGNGDGKIKASDLVYYLAKRGIRLVKDGDQR